MEFRELSAPPEPVDLAEVYEPNTSTWRYASSMITARGIHTATLIEGTPCATPPAASSCSAVLAVGGSGLPGDKASPPPVASAELYRHHPSLSSIDTNSGPSTGGTTVLLRGTGFTSDSTVRFGELPAPGVEVISPTEIKAVTPPHPSGAVHVVVSGPGGTSVAAESEGDEFTYLVSQLPAQVKTLHAEPVSDTEIDLVFQAPASDGAFPPPAPLHNQAVAAAGDRG